MIPDDDDEHMCSKHVKAWNKLIIKFSASSWLILINKYIEMHGQQNIKICDIYVFTPRPIYRASDAGMFVLLDRQQIKIWAFYRFNEMAACS